jgi:hypothetical protein
VVEEQGQVIGIVLMVEEPGPMRKKVGRSSGAAAGRRRQGRIWVWGRCSTAQSPSAKRKVEQEEISLVAVKHDGKKREGGRWSTAPYDDRDGWLVKRT